MGTPYRMRSKEQQLLLQVVELPFLWERLPSPSVDRCHQQMAVGLTVSTGAADVNVITWNPIDPDATQTWTNIDPL